MRRFLQNTAGCGAADSPHRAPHGRPSRSLSSEATAALGALLCPLPHRPVLGSLPTQPDRGHQGALSPAPPHPQPPAPPSKTCPPTPQAGQASRTQPRAEKRTVGGAAARLLWPEDCAPVGEEPEGPPTPPRSRSRRSPSQLLRGDHPHDFTDRSISSRHCAGGCGSGSGAPRGPGGLSSQVTAGGGAARRHLCPLETVPGARDRSPAALQAPLPAQAAQSAWRRHSCWDEQGDVGEP